MTGFTYKGTMGNEYSSRSNPWGIMNQASYNSLLDLANSLNIKSGTTTIDKDALTAFLNERKKEIDTLHARLNSLKNQPYDLGRKIQIDNLWVRINTKEPQIKQLYNHYIRLFEGELWRIRHMAEMHGKPIESVKAPRITFSKFARTYILANLSNFRDTNPETRNRRPRRITPNSKDITEVYNNILASLGLEAFSMSNRNIR